MLRHYKYDTPCTGTESKLRARRLCQDQIRGQPQVFGNKIRFLAEFLTVTSVDKDSYASSSVTAVDIAPAVAHHKAPEKVNGQGLGGLEEHSGTWLAACARGMARVVTDLHAVNRQGGTHFGVHGFHDCLALGAAANVWLVGRNNQEVASLFQPPASFRHLRINLEVLDCGGRVWLAIPNDARVYHPVAVQKDCSIKAAHLNGSFPTS